jgi:negative regulator of sigma E activity
MTTCNKIRSRLTAYLDGELADDHGSVVRGHLRECPACRDVASDEAALRDGLREMPAVDPPASLWAGVQARLAAEEVADARKPPWRRAAERWAQWTRRARWTPTMPQLAAAACVAATAIGVLTWRSRRGDEPAPVAAAEKLSHAPPPAHDALAAATAVVAPDSGAAVAAPDAPAADDVTADLLGEPSRTTASYDRAVGELMKLAEQARTRWSDADKAAFDARIAGMRDAIAHAGQARSAQRAQRSLIRYLQGAVVRDGVMLASASGGPR